jgi:formate--tetrahydrofolate ligase
MKNDLDIAQRASLLPIVPLARDRLGIPEDQLDSYGRYKAKVSLPFLAGLAGRPDGKLVLVSGISPTPAGEGKTTTAVGLADGLNRIGHSAIICLREPSIGPVFGMKGGAAGGGHSQIVPMEDINLHFTGDFHAIALANNLLAALVDNHIHHGNALGIDPRRVSWRRVIDMNDRALRDIVVGLGGPANGHPREDGFDIVAASEVMAILCLATDLQDLKQGLARIVVGQTFDRKPVTAAQLKAQGAMAALLRDAIRPNLVQTLENNPAFVHGGPFANIAHGCSSVIATRAALKLAQVTVTEAGFGADLGAEKFINIKCRKTGLVPDVVVLVATMRALKYHGGADLHQLAYEDLPRLEKGIANLERHLHNLRSHFGLPCVIAVNHFDHDTDAEWAMLRRRLSNQDVPVIRARHFQDGGAGAQELASAVWTLAQSATPALRFSYPDEASLWDKANAVATQLYGASAVSADEGTPAWGCRTWVSATCRCVANSVFVLHRPSLRGAPGGHVLSTAGPPVGAQFVVFRLRRSAHHAGPAEAAIRGVDVDDDGRIIDCSDRLPWFSRPRSVID